MKMKLFNFNKFIAESFDNGDKPYKDYNEKKSIDELEIGDAVNYRGMACSVEEIKTGAITLKLLGKLELLGKNIINVNQAMYNESCYVHEKNKKASVDEPNT